MSMRRISERLGGAAVFGVDAQGFFELVFEDDDAAGGLDEAEVPGRA